MIKVIANLPYPNTVKGFQYSYCYTTPVIPKIASTIIASVSSDIMIIVFFDSLFVPFLNREIRYVIDDTLNELYYDHDNCMIDEDQIGNYNSTSAFYICKSSESKVDCVVRIACEAEGKIIE